MIIYLILQFFKPFLTIKCLKKKIKSLNDFENIFILKKNLTLFKFYQIYYNSIKYYKSHQATQRRILVVSIYLQLIYFSTIVPQPYYYFDKYDEAFDT